VTVDIQIQSFLSSILDTGALAGKNPHSGWTPGPIPTFRGGGKSLTPAGNPIFSRRCPLFLYRLYYASNLNQTRESFLSNLNLSHSLNIYVFMSYYMRAVSFNPLKPSGHYMYHQFNIHQLYVLPTHCICVFCVDLRTNSDYFPLQH